MVKNGLKNLKIKYVRGKCLAVCMKIRNFAPLFHSAAVGMQCSPLSWVGTDNNIFNKPSKWQI